MNKELTYWVALSHLPNWGSKRINAIIVKFHHEEQIGIEAFFHLEPNELSGKYGLTYKELNDLKQIREELGSYAFLAETMQNEGYEVIPVTSADYSPTLKTNLKATASPPVLYIKGNRKILYERSIAIVGSRNAADVSLQFTDNIAKLASKEYKVVVSGFAKGVDKQALDSALKYKGQSIIVLPQGIMTFGSGFQKYYRQIVDGDLLVLSVFQPKAPWQASLAMARNTIIYGLAAEIFVAESSDSGGTWSGTIDGLRKGRNIFIRKPVPNEKNANELLIKKGAIPVDMEGKVVIEDIRVKEAELFSQVMEPAVTYERNILTLLSKGTFSSGELIRYLKLEMTEQSLTELLSNHTGVETLKETPPRFRLKSDKPKQTELF